MKLELLELKLKLIKLDLKKYLKKEKNLDYLKEMLLFKYLRY
jgi:hypothetical protein